MIQIHDGPVVQCLLFLTLEEQSLLEDLAAQSEPEAWRKGRQGSGYLKLNLQEDLDNARFNEDLEWLTKVVDRAKHYIMRKTNTVISGLTTDAWLIAYPRGSFVPLHKDPVPEGKMMVRLNALVVAPDDGGSFLLEEEQKNGNEPVAYTFDMNTPGDALIFRPSEDRHSVSECNGFRLVLSVGALMDKPFVPFPD